MVTVGAQTAHTDSVQPYTSNRLTYTNTFCWNSHENDVDSKQLANDLAFILIVLFGWNEDLSQTIFLYGIWFNMNHAAIYSHTRLLWTMQYRPHYWLLKQILIWSFFYMEFLLILSDPRTFWNGYSALFIESKKEVKLVFSARNTPTYWIT